MQCVVVYLGERESVCALGSFYSFRFVLLLCFLGGVFCAVCKWYVRMEVTMLLLNVSVSFSDIER